MPRYEVSIPARPPEQPMALTFRVEAQSWLEALQVGLSKVDVPAEGNILCDVQRDGAVEVSDPRSGRVFRIAEAGIPPHAGVAGPHTSPRPPRPRRSPADQKREELLADLFVRAPLVSQRGGGDEGTAYLLDLAMEKIPCEAARAILADADGILRLAVARGAGAEQLMARRVELDVGAGIAGFCARENVGLAVSDAERDPRFDLSVQARGSPTRSVLCAPIGAAGRVFGVLELVNKAGGTFDEGDLAALSYLAHQAARFLEEREAAAPLEI